MDICISHNILMISDEIHHDIAMPGYKHIPTATLCSDGLFKLMVCTAPSKTFNLAGLNAANIIIPDQNLRKMYIQRMEEHHLLQHLPILKELIFPG